MTESTSFYPPLNALLHATSIISRAYSTIIKQPKYAIVKRKQSHKLIKLMIDFRDKIDVSKITIKLKNNLKSKVINNIVNPVYIECINNIIIIAFDKQQLPVSSRYGEMKFVIFIDGEKLVSTNTFFVYSRMPK